MKKLRDRLDESYKLAADHAEKSVGKNKTRFDLKVRESVLLSGDKVLV